MRQEVYKNRLFKEAIDFLESKDIGYGVRKTNTAKGLLDFQIFIEGTFKEEEWLTLAYEIGAIENTDAKNRIIRAKRVYNGFKWTHTVLMLGY